MGTNARIPEAVSKAVSEELRVIRARRVKESVRELADRCGVPYSTLHKTLAGERMVDVEELEKIARALDTTGSAVLAAVESRLAVISLDKRRRRKRGPSVAPPSLEDLVDEPSAAEPERRDVEGNDEGETP